MRLHLLVTGRCNLRCGYCYQTDRRVRARMSPATAEAAVGEVLGAGDPPHSVVLSGGEPFLSPALVRRLVWRLRAGRPADAVECTVLTNGTLISDGDVDFLARHQVHLQVSFDGLPAAQGRRARGTHATLLRRLERTLERHPEWARSHLSVSMTVQAATVTLIAPSVELLLSRELRDVQMAPLTTHDAEWSRSVGTQLEEQVDRVVQVSRGVWDQAGVVPVSFLRVARPDVRSDQRPPGALCGVSSPESVTVDPDGRAWACPAFVGSLQRLPALGREVNGALDLGGVLAPGFRGRLARLPREGRKRSLFRSKELKWSVRGPCRACRFMEQCLVCPGSTVHIPGNQDPHRVPDHQCDFQFVTLGARRRFQSEIRPGFVPPFFTQPPLPLGPPPGGIR